MAKHELEISGADWLRQFMEAQALVIANSMWITFGIGQAGAAFQAGELKHAAKVIEALKGDHADLVEAAAKLATVTGHMLANMERNLGQARPASG